MGLCARCQANYDEDQANTEPAIIVGSGWYAPAGLLAAAIFHEPSCEPVELCNYWWHFQTHGRNFIKAYRAWQENKESVDAGEIAHGYPTRVRDSLPEIRAERGGIKYERIQLKEND
jgi:hypothetical protein